MNTNIKLSKESIRDQVNRDMLEAKDKKKQDKQNRIEEERKRIY